MAVELSREVLLAAHAGDLRARERLGVWMTAKLPPLYQGYGHPLEDAWELSQQTMLEVLQKFDQAPDDPERFCDFVEAFAAQTAKRKRSNDQRHDNKRAAASVYPWTPARSPDSKLAIRRLLAWLRTELSKLPSPYRRTLGLTLEHDSHRQVADALDVSEQTVRWRVWKGRQMLERAQQRKRRTRES